MLYLISANRAATLAADDAVISAAAVAPLREAASVLQTVERLRNEVAGECAAGVERATAEGYAAGEAEGRAAASASAAHSLFDLNVRAAAERQAMRADVSRLALEVVRRITSDLGDDATVAALADRAARDLAPDTVAVVRVAPGAVEATSERLRAYSGLTVVGDAARGPTDCIIETPLGASHAGLDVQLAAVERAWGPPDAD
ncbi:hypothetical protein [Glacieibacterium frigidum]|uniref:Flagellar assembly protein FliH/Type III secretion system HrpE domain-containing protein n=1 Tax=Glacieibacterium frigidum TaxID=2593303 RepID=A0A552UGL1_9SPHN|nr:hypothetical protein [Glacieibacterium frigidum]TRW17373.1 hypothetical protein FMM06_04150 [Glacieibacterium frigidum]